MSAFLGERERRLVLGRPRNWSRNKTKVEGLADCDSTILSTSALPTHLHWKLQWAGPCLVQGNYRQVGLCTSLEHRLSQLEAALETRSIDFQAVPGSGPRAKPPKVQKPKASHPSLSLPPESGNPPAHFSEVRVRMSISGPPPFQTCFALLCPVLPSFASFLGFSEKKHQDDGQIIPLGGLAPVSLASFLIFSLLYVRLAFDWTVATVRLLAVVVATATRAHSGRHISWRSAAPSSQGGGD